MDVRFASALLGHRSHPAEALQIFGPGETFALRAHAGQQAWSQDRSGARQRFKDFPVGVLLEKFRDLFVELFNGLEQELEFSEELTNYEPEKST